MSESVRRRKYRWDRVLIESDRVLNPQFDDAVVYLTGAQIEMLRNVSQYLNRLDTYVTEYKPGYYIAPTAADYDDILEIVADLEETLMGNPNTIWGYKDRFQEHDAHTMTGDGDWLMWVFTVPAGYVYELNLLYTQNADTVVTHEQVLYDAGYNVHFAVYDAHPAGKKAISANLHYRLKAGDRLRVNFIGCLNGDDLTARAWGYKMKVPE